ncbi:MAG: hypothetical protein CMQ40_10145 [Gammaproteobacteria bacterium]|nr:hypothetical protein [Gammaproteobacteria bacterium]
MKGQILLTGASGFIGEHCVLDLLANDYDVVGTLRNPSREKILRTNISKYGFDNRRIKYKHADLRQPDEIYASMEGCDAVFHVASPVPIAQPKDSSEIIEVARQGTLNVLEAAVIRGIKRVILTSSVATIFGKGGKRKIYNSSDWTNPEEKDLTPYTLSKTLAEKSAWSFSRENKIDLTTIHPSLVLGPALGKDYGSSLEALVKILKKEILLIPRFGFEIVDVRDVAALHRIALENTQSVNKRLIASNRFMWFQEIAEIIDETFPERNIPTKLMPDIGTWILSLFITELRQITKDLGKEKKIDNTESLRLDWNPKEIKNTVIDSVNSLIDLDII